jgi:cytochrome c-type biogenesis protein CcmH/NrfG
MVEAVEEGAVSETISVEEPAPSAPASVAEEEIPVEEPMAVEADVTPSAEAIESIEAQRAHLDENPHDYDAWLDLARGLWQIKERDEAVGAYNQVIDGGALLEDVIHDLEQGVEQFPDADLQQALGDAYMKAGRVDDALQTYRRALEAL